MKRLIVSFVTASVLSAASLEGAFAQDAMRMMEHTGPAASPGASGSTGGMNTTTGGVQVGASGGPSIADVHGANRGIPSKAEAGTISDSTSRDGLTVAPNSTGAVASRLGIAATGANGASTKSQNSP